MSSQHTYTFVRANNYYEHQARRRIGTRDKGTFTGMESITLVYGNELIIHYVNDIGTISNGTEIKIYDGKHFSISDFDVHIKVPKGTLASEHVDETLIDRIVSGESACITGRHGTGKSYIANMIMEAYKKKNPDAYYVYCHYE